MLEFDKHSELQDIYYKETELSTIPQMFTNLLYSISFYCDIIPIQTLSMITEKIKINLDTIPCLCGNSLMDFGSCELKDSTLKKNCKVKTIDVLFEIRKFFLLLHFFSMTNSDTCLFFLNQIESLQNLVLRNCNESH